MNDDLEHIEAMKEAAWAQEGGPFLMTRTEKEMWDEYCDGKGNDRIGNHPIEIYDPTH